MKKLSKLILPAIFIVVIAIMYFTYFARTDEVGSLDKFSPGSEINQEVNVRVVKSKIERDASGNISSFYAIDKNNVEVQVTSHEPIPAEVANTEVVELFGHMHGNSLVAAKITIIK
ncbi:hypothetical protein APF79_06950 [bacterium BRH_c32]|jgi:hypothetical protein|nr:MAG: hypothetical protein APF79_13830 [bacterium BRH_c32]KUO63504.1 MAG: hypothetical protein APF79_06950 [bacterium BRH_c32]